MKIIKELNQSDRTALNMKHKLHYLFPSHIAPVLDSRYCYWVNIFPSDYDKIWVGSCLPNCGSSNYQHLSEAIVYIKTNEDFWSRPVQGCLDVARLKKYLKELTYWTGNLPKGFIKLGDCFLLDKGTVYNPHEEVTDGMHRLIAYGIASDLAKEEFPIPVYLGTQRDLAAFETS